MLFVGLPPFHRHCVLHRIRGRDQPARVEWLVQTDVPGKVVGVAATAIGAAGTVGLLEGG